MKVIICSGTFRVEAALFDTPTGRAIFSALPFKGRVNRWGEEIYFGIPVHASLEPGARAGVAAGDLGYWPDMPAFCIFFGATPASDGDTPVAASPVNVFGKLLKVELTGLGQIRNGEEITVEKAIQIPG